MNLFQGIQKAKVIATFLLICLLSVFFAPLANADLNFDETMRKAEQGDTDAQNDLAKMYYAGSGVAQNYIYSYAWIDLAASHGHEEALQYRVKIASALTQQQLAEAQQLTAELNNRIFGVSQPQPSSPSASNTPPVELSNQQTSINQSVDDQQQQPFDPWEARRQKAAMDYGKPMTQDFKDNVQSYAMPDGSVGFSDTDNRLSEKQIGKGWNSATDQAVADWKTGKKVAEYKPPLPVSMSNQQTYSNQSVDQNFTGQKIALNFYQAEFRNIMKIISAVSGLNIIVDDDVNATVTINIEKPEPWDQILDTIMQEHQLEATRSGNTIRVSNAKGEMAQEAAPATAETNQNPPATAEEVATEPYKKAEFSISLPAGWIEIPRSTIDVYEARLTTSLAPDATMQHFDYGFQLDASKNWFEYPYILVQVNNMGRLPGSESQWEKINGPPSQEIIDKFKNWLSPIMSDIQVGNMVYDKQNKIIWMRAEANNQDVGPIAGISGMVPTETGLIIIGAWSLKADFLVYEPIFQSVAISVSPDPSIVYKPKWTDNLPPAIKGLDWGKITGKAMAGTMAVGLIYGIFVLVAALKKKKDESVEPIQELAKTSNIAAPTGTPLFKKGTKKCPFCAEEIKADAIKCKYCGEFIEVS